MRKSLLAGLFVLICAHARADIVVTETTGPVSYGPISVLDEDPPEVSLPLLAPVLDGSPLQSVSIEVAGQVGEYIFNNEPYPGSGGVVPVSFSVGLIGKEDFFGTHVVFDVLTNGQTASFSHPFDDTFVATNPTDFTVDNTLDFRAGAFVAALAGPYTDDIQNGLYTITETATYVPEPASVAILASGVIGLLAAGGAARRRPR